MKYEDWYITKYHTAVLCIRTLGTGYDDFLYIMGYSLVTANFADKVPLITKLNNMGISFAASCRPNLMK